MPARLPTPSGVDAREAALATAGLELRSVRAPTRNLSPGCKMGGAGQWPVRRPGAHARRAMAMLQGAANQPTGAELAGHPALALPASVDLDVARDAAAGCRACDLWERATQTVFGEGRRNVPLMLVGEQPGDREDLEGRPFVGPAGRLLDEALVEAGIDREHVFVTNVVKHFKWRPQGKRRLHERPNPGQIRACRPWLELELELVRPNVLVMLGATAAQALLGRDFRVTERHGELLPPLAAGGPQLVATFHPSAILRARTPEDRDRQRRALVDDLASARAAVVA